MSDPLLTPFQIGNLSLKNRIVSTPHAPALAEDVMPKERYQRYHLEKAKGGIAMTMIGGHPVLALIPLLFLASWTFHLTASFHILPNLRNGFTKRIAALSVKYHIWGVELPGMMGTGCQL